MLDTILPLTLLFSDHHTAVALLNESLFWRNRLSESFTDSPPPTGETCRKSYWKIPTTNEQTGTRTILYEVYKNVNAATDH